MKRIIPSIVAALVAGTLAALAANTTFFTSIGDVVFPISPPSRDGTTPGAIDNMTIGGTTPRVVTGTLHRGPWGTYVKTGVPAYPFSSTFADYQVELLIEPSGTLTYFYATLAASPGDGMRQCIFSTQIVTRLYVSAGAGQSINNAVTTLGANGRVCYTYSLSNTTWDRSQ